MTPVGKPETFQTSWVGDAIVPNPSRTRTNSAQPPRRPCFCTLSTCKPTTSENVTVLHDIKPPFTFSNPRLLLQAAGGSPFFSRLARRPPRRADFSGLTLVSAVRVRRHAGGGVCVELRVADRRVRFPAVAALARARVAPCAAGVRQSRDCLRPRSPRRPRVLASAAPFSSGNRPHFHSIRRALASRALVPVAGARPRSADGAWLASAGRMRRDAVVSRRPALASAAPCVRRRRPCA